MDCDSPTYSTGALTALLDSMRSVRRNAHTRHAFRASTYLNAVRWNYITEAVVIVTEKFWEVVQKHQQDSQGSFVQQCDRLCKFCIAKKWSQELEQVDEKLSVHSPTLHCETTQMCYNIEFKCPRSCD